MPTNTAWSRPTTRSDEGPTRAAEEVLARLLPPGCDTDAELRNAGERADATAIALGGSRGSLAAAGVLLSEVLAGLPERLGGFPVSRDIVARVAAAADTDPGWLAFAVAERTFAHPRIASLPPALAAGAVLELLALTAPLAHASLWRRDPEGATDCFFHAGSACPTRSVRDAARRALHTTAAGPRQGLLQVVRVPGRDDAVLVARPARDGRRRCLAFLQLAVAAVAPALDRLAEAERDLPSGQLLAAASERRLARIGFDIHDGPAQSLAALLADARLLQTQVAELGDDDLAMRVAGRVGDLTARAVALEFEVRSLCQSLSCPTLVRPLECVIEQEVITFQRLTGLRPRLELSGCFDELSDSQRIALLRIVQEALRNVREHARARSVAVVVCARPTGTEAIVVDDGHGFDVDAALSRAVREGRIGLVGMMERIRLLGGTCAVRSRTGGPTTVAVTLPRWEPAAASSAAELAA